MAIEIRVHIPALKDIIVLSKSALKRLSATTLPIFRKACTRVVVDLTTKKWRGLIVLALSVSAFFLWGLSSALLWFLFLLFLAYAWESRIVAFFALVCLASCPFLLSFSKDTLAETMAVYAYYFLVMTVSLQLAELIREDRSEKGKEGAGNDYEKIR